MSLIDVLGHSCSDRILRMSSGDALRRICFDALGLNCLNEIHCDLQTLMAGTSAGLAAAAAQLHTAQTNSQKQGGETTCLEARNVLTLHYHTAAVVTSGKMSKRPDEAVET